LFLLFDFGFGFGFDSVFVLLENISLTCVFFSSLLFSSLTFLSSSSSSTFNIFNLFLHFLIRRLFFRFFKHQLNSSFEVSVQHVLKIHWFGLVGKCRKGWVGLVDEKGGGFVEMLEWWMGCGWWGGGVGGESREGGEGREGKGRGRGKRREGKGKEERKGNLSDC